MTTASHKQPAEESLVVRLKQAHTRAAQRVKNGSAAEKQEALLQARKLEQWVSQVTSIESGLKEMEGERG